MASSASRILIVDSDSTRARSLSEILEKRGYVAHTAADIDAACALMTSLSPDLAACSLSLGPDAVTRLRGQSREGGTPTPVLGVWDDATQVQKRAALDAGATDFLKAPFDAVDVEARVKSLLASRELLKRTQYLATHDPLTRCANRSALIEFLTREMERHKRFQKPFTLVVLDLDGFAAINKDLGQPTGDLALTHVGYRLLDFFRAVDCVARLDGDQFAVVLPDCGMSAALKVGDRLMAELLASSGKPALPKTLKTRLRFSAGLACAPDHGGTVDELFQAAEKALDTVKTAGGHAFRIYTKKQA